MPGRHPNFRLHLACVWRVLKHVVIDAATVGYQPPKFRGSEFLVPVRIPHRVAIVDDKAFAGINCYSLEPLL